MPPEIHLTRRGLFVIGSASVTAVRQKGRCQAKNAFGEVARTDGLAPPHARKTEVEYE